MIGGSANDNIHAMWGECAREKAREGKCAADPSHSFLVPSTLTAAHRLQVVALSQIWQLATHAVQTLDAGSGK